jgi:AbrB family looped-hinge helix DNA binding protein
MTMTVTNNNEVSIPPWIAREFEIHPGTRLEWAKTTDGAIIVKPLPDRGELGRQLMGAG